jgi:hypothetical protein
MTANRILAEGVEGRRNLMESREETEMVSYPPNGVADGGIEAEGAMK